MSLLCKIFGHKRWVEERFNRNGPLYKIRYRCPRCDEIMLEPHEGEWVRESPPQYE